MTISTNALPVEGMTVRHRKRNTFYKVIATAALQTSSPIPDNTALVVYQGEDGRYWARPVTEFVDGRFEPVSKEI